MRSLQVVVRRGGGVVGRCWAVVQRPNYGFATAWQRPSQRSQRPAVVTVVMASVSPLRPLQLPKFQVVAISNGYGNGTRCDPFLGGHVAVAGRTRTRAVPVGGFRPLRTALLMTRKQERTEVRDAETQTQLEQAVQLTAPRTPAIQMSVWD